MTRRTFLSSASMVALAQPAKPNIIVILADDLGYKDLGYAGGPQQTPHLDGLAKGGLRLENFYTYPLCSPTRSALMTGRNPIRFGLAYSVVRPWAYYGLPVDEELLPAAFQSAGYQTAIIGKWHLGHANKKLHPRSRGFDHFYGHLNGAIDYNTHDRNGGIDWQRNGVSVKEDGYTTELFAAEAVRWIHKRDPARPYFLYLPFNAPHTPLQAPQALIDKYASIRNPRRRTYAAMVDAMDQAIGKIIGAIDLSNTIVFFASDNGGPRGSGADNGLLREGKATTYEGGIRVLGFVHAPGRLKPGTSKQVMAMWDVLPTLAGAAGVELRTKKRLDGLNLWPVLTGQEPVVARNGLFFCTQPETGVKQYAVRDGDWKMVRTMTSPVREELFHISEDPYEKNNVLGNEYAMGFSLRKLLDDWIALHPRGDVMYSADPHPGWVVPKDWAKVTVE